MTGGFYLRNKVKELRLQYGLTQAQLGDNVKVSRQAINAIETNKFDPSILLAHDLAKFFKLSIEDIFIFEESERK